MIELSKNIHYTSRGIYYWSFMFKYKPKLLHFDESVIKSVYRKVKDTLDFQLNPTDNENIQQIPVIPQIAQVQPEDVPKVINENQISDDKNKVCWLRKTDYPDVYDVYDQIQGTKVGVAYVPTLAKSKMLRNIFKNATVAMYIAFDCEFNDTNKKWLPLNIHSSE